MSDTPGIIYLIPGKEIEGVEKGRSWSCEPDPSYADDPADAVEYVRADTHKGSLNIISQRLVDCESGIARREMMIEQLRARVAELESSAMQVGIGYAKSYILRKQAETAEKLNEKISRLDSVSNPERLDCLLVIQFIASMAGDEEKRLRDEAEKAGGE